MQIKINNPQKNLYILTDSHLDHSDAPFEEFIVMLQQLEDPEAIFLLGDLFKVWLALPKYWAPINRQVMDALMELRNRGVLIYFIIGNREVLLPRHWSEKSKVRFPFTKLFQESCALQWGSFHYGFAHGDTINRHDLQYLKWRKIARGRMFEWFFRLLPPAIARKIAEKLEKGLNTSNKAFKIHFPQEEVEHYAKSVLQGIDCYFIGHFHEDKEIKLPGVKGYLRVVPDWLSKKALIQIDKNGLLKTLYFREGQIVDSPQS